MSDAGVGAKYEFGYGEKWGFAADTAITFASGTNDFSSNGTGVTLNGIMAYNVNADIGVEFQLGLSHVFSPAYPLQTTSINPILVVSDQLNEITGNLQLYAEVYNFVDIAPDNNVSSFIDAGVQYLVTPDVEVDVEAGHNLTDIPLNNTTYVGFGAGIEF